MWIYLLRHGPAGRRDAERWPDDAQRPLTARGARRTERAAHGLANLENRAVCLLTSPLERALQTARLLEQALSLVGPLQVVEELAPGVTPARVIARLQRLASSATVVLVGHEPDLGRLGGVLVFGDADHGIPLKKAGCCAIAFDGPARMGEGRLMWLLTPRLLRRGARRKATP